MEGDSDVKRTRIAHTRARTAADRETGEKRERTECIMALRIQTARLIWRISLG